MEPTKWLEFGYPLNDRVEARERYHFGQACESCAEMEVSPHVNNEYHLQYKTLGYNPDGSRAYAWVLECSDGNCGAQYWPEAEYE